MIVKVQKPLRTNGVPEVLIYNEDRSIMWFEKYNWRWKKWFGRELKRYARAHVDNKILVIDEVVMDQEW